jgi:aminomethyltransferase
MVPFAGYDMPVNYPGGIIAEHKQCRESAALFDVSHMGQVRLVGDDAARALETLVPVDVLGLAVGQQRYALFTDASGGILDDLMVTRREADLLLVVNAGCKDADIRAPGHPHRPPLPGGADARARAAGAAGPAGGGGAGASEPRRGRNWCS